MRLRKGCDWYKGKSGFPDTTKCKFCVYCINCLGRNYAKWRKLKTKLKLEKAKLGVEE